MPIAQREYLRLREKGAEGIIWLKVSWLLAWVFPCYTIPSPLKDLEASSLGSRQRPAKAETDQGSSLGGEAAPSHLQGLIFVRACAGFKA
jgi:hypothetical protein